MKKPYSKYFARKVTVDGIEFHSSKEAKRYKELKLLERIGKIKNLKLQVPFVIIPTQYESYISYTPKKKIPKESKRVVEKMAKYIADFTYETEDGEYVVEDAKGYKDSTAYEVFVLKRKLMFQVHGIKVREV